MPPRALRKLQRQQEQDRLGALGKPAEEGEEESDEEEQPANTRQKSAFALLGEPAEEDDPDVLVDYSNEETHYEARPTAKDEDHASQDQVTTKAKKKKKTKKDKKKAKEASFGAGPAISTQKAELDDIDRALKELRVRDEGKKGESATASLPTEVQSFYQLLSVDSKNLKVLNEMKRLFGSSVLESENEGGGAGRRRGRGPQQLDLGAALDRRNNPLSRGQGLSERILRKNIFIQGKDSWVKETGGGLGMEVVEQAEDFTTEYRYVHGMGYQRSQREFDICVESMDPQRMIYFLQMNPYHISGLLQVAEIARQHQEPAVSVDLIERALFSFGRAAHSTFNTAMAEGKARMDFRRPENRELWLAGWRYVRSLGQRGTWRTAFEWAKLLFSLDPEGDPYQVRLVVDQLAMRAGQFTQLVSLASTDKSTLDWGQDLPNIRISLALAHDRLKQPQEARAVLSEAVQKWPWMIARLLRELDIDRIPKSVWGTEPRTPREELHTTAYVTRAKDLWNTPEAVSLLVEVAETTDALASLPKADESEIDLNEARHFLLDETPSLLGLLPRAFTNLRTSASDPLPPEDDMPSYNVSNLDAAPHSDESEEVSDTEEDDGGGGLVWSWANRMLGMFGRAPPAAAATADDEANEGAAQEAAAAPAEEAQRAANQHQRTQDRAQAQEQLLAEQEDAMLAEAIRQSQAEMQARQAAEIATGERQRPSEEHSPAATPAPPSSSTPAPAHAAPSPPSSPSSTDDPQRTQRWLAGRGLLALKDFAATHGVDESSWGFSLDDDRAAPLREYVERARTLPVHQRRFILEFALPQGAGREVGGLVRRLV
jgi:Transcriptional repressor TCF25